MFRFSCYRDCGEAPVEFKDSPSGCGLVSVWMLLDHFDYPIDRDQIIRFLDWTEAEGTSAIAIACLFKRLGFDSVFYTDEDPDIQDTEIPFYQLASVLELPIKPAINLTQVGERIGEGSHFIALYREDLSDLEFGHFSPITGTCDNSVQLAYSAVGDLDFDDFRARWKCDGFPCQLIEVRTQSVY